LSNPVIHLQQYKEKEQQTPLKLIEESTDDDQSVDAGIPWKRTAAVCFAIAFIILAIIGLSTFGNDNYYTIKKGENAYVVANKFNVPLNVLLNLNEMDLPSQIKEGIRIKIPSVHDVHLVKEGDTYYSIAMEYGIKRYDLAKYNQLNGATIPKTGDRVFIPRVLSAILVSSNTRTGMVPFTAKFNIDTNTRDRIRSYLWDLGNGTTSSKRNPSINYDQKGDYYVSLSVVDENGNSITSNTIHVVARKLAHIKFNAPRYFVKNQGDIISLDTEVIDNLNNKIEFNFVSKIDQKPSLISQIDTTDSFEIIRSGYSRITFTVADKYEHVSNFFVSPIPSRHVPEPDAEWYKTQFRTGVNGNCGPSCISMAIYWAKNEDVDVRYIRKLIGMPNEEGKIGFQHMINVFKQYKVPHKYHQVYNPQDIRNIIDEGKIAIILLDTGKITRTKGNVQADFFGRYYKDTVGHYIIIKGYSLDGEYFVVYDPIPSDWVRDRLKYADGSNLGKNRYYPAEEIMNAIKVKTHSFLVVTQG
jgi:PKD repeat protein